MKGSEEAARREERTAALQDVPLAAVHEVVQAELWFRFIKAEWWWWSQVDWVLKVV
jgi:hypothetical protein